MADMQKNLPCALEAEQSVLGSILIDPNCFADLTEIIHADDFYLDEHGEIFYAMQDLFAKSREIDLVCLRYQKFSDIVQPKPPRRSMQNCSLKRL